jgi:YcaO-like protein with predicted kinase domain
LEVIQPWLKRAGISRVAEITYMDRIGIPVYVSIRPDSRSLSVDSGKGTSRMQAKCSASMEGLERWSLDEVPIASFPAPGKTGLANFALNRGAQVEPERSSRLVNAKSLQTGDVVRVPYFAVKMYEGSESLVEKAWFASTNGMSAGSTREEAISAGLFECIERDGVHLAMNKVVSGVPAALDRLDTDSVDDPECVELLEKIRAAGCEAFIYDTRNELKIPTFQCLLVDRERGVHLAKGYRCHSDKWIALCGAICEAAQSRCVVLAGARDDVTWAKHRKLIADSAANNWVAALGSEKPRVTMEEIPSVEEGVVEIMEEHGMNPLVVDFPIPPMLSVLSPTTPNGLSDPPFACVKVLVPGFASYWLPYAEPGRPSYGGGR